MQQLIPFHHWYLFIKEAFGNEELIQGEEWPNFMINYNDGEMIRFPEWIAHVGL